MQLPQVVIREIHDQLTEIAAPGHGEIVGEFHIFFTDGVAHKAKVVTSKANNLKLNV